MLAADTPLTPDEAVYVAAARAHDTRRGYRSVRASFTAMPAVPATVSARLGALVQAGAKVRTIAEHLSGIPIGPRPTSCCSRAFLGVEAVGVEIGRYQPGVSDGEESEVEVRSRRWQQ